MQDTHVSFRAPEKVVSALSERARIAGCTVSEYLRTIVCENVGPPESPKGLHVRAADGDVAALTELAGAYYAKALNREMPPEIALATATVYSRFAGMQGGRAELINHMFLTEQWAMALDARGLDQLAHLYQSEAVAIADLMANEGDEEFGNMLVAAGEHLARDVGLDDHRTANDLRMEGVRQGNRVGMENLRQRNRGSLEDARQSNRLTLRTTPQAPRSAKATGGGDIPTVRTPEEAMRLPSGTRFRTPNGQIKVVP